MTRSPSSGPSLPAHGKDKVTVRHLLSHQGGFPETPASLPWTDWADWSKVCAAMEQAIPKYAAGEVMSYHPINYGWVIAELVRRIDGRSFDRFLAEDLAAPLQMQNTYVNIPPEHDGRVSRIHLLEDDADPNGYAAVFDKPEVHHTITPGANGIASAGDLARFYAMMERRGTLDRAQVLRPETICGRGHPASGRHRPFLGPVRPALPGSGPSGRADGHAFG